MLNKGKKITIRPEDVAGLRRRLEAKIVKSPNPGECHGWLGACCRGRPHAKYRGFTRYVVRLLWLLAGRELPVGHDLDHTCQNRACVNIDHVSPRPALSHRSNWWEDKQLECPV
jgi:hypothetical protein